MFLVKLLSGIFYVMFLPGVLYTLVRSRTDRRDLLESVSCAFGYSMVLLAPTGLILSIFHGSITHGIIIHTVVVFGLAAWVCKKHSNGTLVVADNFDVPETLGGWVLAILAYASVAVILVMSYKLEMRNRLTQEDCVTLMMAQKMRSLSHYHVDQLMFKPGDMCVYLSSCYAYLLALLSKASGLEVLQLYCKLRFVFGFLAIAGTYALARNVFSTRKEIGYLTVLCACAATWQGWGVSYAPGVFYQFIPDAMYVDFALCVMLPTCLLFFLKALRGGRAELVASLVLTNSLFFIHTREILILLVLYTACILAQLIYCFDRRCLIRGVIIIVGCLTVGLVDRGIQKHLVDSHIFEWEAVMKEVTGTRLSAMLEGGINAQWFYPPLDAMDLMANNAFLMFPKHPYYLVSAFVLPLLLWYRRIPGFVLLGSLLAFPLLLSCVPVLTLLFLKATYSQVLFGAPVTLGLFPISYIAVAVLLWMVLDVFQRSLLFVKRGNLKLLISLAAAGMVYFAFLTIFTGADWMYTHYKANCYLWFLCGTFAVAGLTCFVRLGIPADVIGCPRPGFSLYLCPAAIIGVLILIRGTPVTEPIFEVKSLLTRYKEAGESDSVASWQSWYSQSGFAHLPWSAVCFMRRSIPEASVVAAPVDDWYLYHIPALTNQLVYTSGSFISLLESDFFDKLYRERTGVLLSRRMMDDDAFREQFLKARFGTLPYPDQKKVQYFTAMIFYCDELMRTTAPIFNQHDSIEETLRLIKRFEIQYIFVPPPHRHYVDSRFSERPDRFEKIFDADSCAIYRVLAPHHTREIQDHGSSSIPVLSIAK